LLNARKEEKLSTNELPTRRGWDSPSSFFCPTSCSNQESIGFFLPTSYIQGQVRESQGSHWVHQGWSIATKRECEKVKKRKKKKKDQGRQEGGSSKGKVPCVLHQEFLFFGSRVFGLRSGQSRLKYRLLRDLVYKEAMCKGSSGNGLLYAAKAVP
jgi:hypothetical protein